MTWSDTHRYYQALRTVEADLDRLGRVVWYPEFDAVFTDQDGLRLALQRRWQIMVETQVEQMYHGVGRPSRELLDLAARHRGLVRGLVEIADPAWRAEFLPHELVPDAHARASSRRITLCRLVGDVVGAW
jgi:hypothetical protein